MNCPECRPLLHEYFGGGLTIAQRTAIDEHEASCASCHALMETAREITCRAVSDFLNEYVDGELSSDRRAVFERHLAICGECRDYLASYRATIQLGQRALKQGEIGMDAKMPEKLVLAILDARRRSRIDPAS
ncbi:MAG: zf-HC2 domain-containing protein [Planctomycetota bacterium]